MEYLTRRASSQGSLGVLGNVCRHHDRFGLCVGLRGRTLGSTVRGVSGGKHFVQALKKKKVLLHWWICATDSDSESEV